jgi:hypothetical protein
MTHDLVTDLLEKPNERFRRLIAGLSTTPATRCRPGSRPNQGYQS